MCSATAVRLASSTNVEIEYAQTGKLITLTCPRAYFVHIFADSQEVYKRGGASDDERVWFSWLPTFHDMGLIQGTLAPFVGGWRSAYCSPMAFMRNPLVWLQIMSKEESQMTAAPDFAFRLCVRKW